jgi:DNA adenine methylase
MKSPITWYGGKYYSLKILLKYIPNHTTYVEVFGGAASLLFAKNPSKVEVYNDSLSGLVNLFRVLRDKEKFDKFYEQINLIPYSREEFIYARKNRDPEDEIERTVNWFVLIRQSFSRNMKTWGYSINAANRLFNERISKYLNTVKNLPQAHRRLFLVQMENLDYREIIPKYDMEDTFFYLDPPYVLSTRKDKNYEHEMSDEDHKELISILLKIKGKVMLSGYDNTIYRELEDNGWTKIQYDIQCCAPNSKDTTGTRERRIESVWMNYKHIFQFGHK